MSPVEEPKSTTGRRTVCDHCRRRRIRCDGNFPCNQCNNASLTCKRDHVPKRRGPKRGSGRVINELRAREGDIVHPIPKSNESGTASQDSEPPSIDQWMSETREDSTSPTAERHDQQKWHPIMSDWSQPVEEPSSMFTTDQFRPVGPSYFHLIPTCLDLFMEHIYPIMPLVHMPTLRASITRPLERYEMNLLYSLCALTSTHMSGKSIQAPGPPSWEAAGRFFLDECISVRQTYDFVEDKSLSAVISSYFVHTAFFELNQNRKSWYYLREALTLGQDLGFHEESTYAGLSPAEALCRRRTFWILYITERSYAILRHKPLTLSKTPSFPTTVHSYESPTIHTGFTHLVNAYHLLDASFVDAWNESAAAPASTATYTLIQQQLNLPHPAHISLTDIQKADILVTQQWLRLIVWQSSMRQGLLSSSAADESMTFRYPLSIAHSLLGVITSLPTTSIEVHGMGIFEKIFEIGNTMLDVLHACGEDYGSGRGRGVLQDPFEVFVRTLSLMPNSQEKYARMLLLKAEERPEVLRWSQNPSLGDLAPPGPGTLAGVDRWRGSIVGEIGDDGVFESTRLAAGSGADQCADASLRADENGNGNAEEQQPWDIEVDDSLWVPVTEEEGEGYIDIEISQPAPSASSHSLSDNGIGVWDAEG